MAFTSDQLTALEAAAATGVLTVRYADRTVTYQSLAEMRSLITQMRQELSTSQDNYRLIGTCKGL